MYEFKKYYNEDKQSKKLHDKVIKLSEQQLRQTQRFEKKSKKLPHPENGAEAHDLMIEIPVDGVDAVRFETLKDRFDEERGVPVFPGTAADADDFHLRT